MNDSPTTPCSLDLVELFVPDPAAAAAWYAEALGLTPVPETGGASGTSEGPLVISADRGHTKLALFHGQPQGPRPTAGWHRVAFRMDASGFLEFLERARRLRLRDRKFPLRIHDHGTVFSVSFCDPYGHRLAVTTYDHAAARAAIPRAEISDDDPTAF